MVLAWASGWRANGAADRRSAFASLRSGIQRDATPFGIKGGLVPLLVSAAYMANVGEITWYEHGNYVTMPDTAMFDRLQRQPSYFAIRRSRVTGARVIIYERLARTLAPRALGK